MDRWMKFRFTQENSDLWENLDLWMAKKILVLVKKKRFVSDLSIWTLGALPLHIWSTSLG